MPSPRELNKRVITQSQQSNDKTLGLIVELINRLNMTGKPIEQLYQDMLENPETLKEIQYSNIITPLLTALYHIEQIDDAITIARLQI